MTHAHPETFDIVAHARRVRRRQNYPRYATLGAGLTLLAASFSQRLPLRPLMAALGAGLLLRGISGRPLRDTVKRLKENAARRKRRRPNERGRDVVDEASWESFPASDPPGYAPRP